MSPERASPTSPASLAQRVALSLALVLGVSGITWLHLQTPVVGHGAHLEHLFLGKLYALPLLLAAAWFGGRAVAAATAAVTVLFGWHILRDWSGDAMQQWNLLGELVSLWLLVGVAALLFARLRHALAALRQAHDETLEALAASLDLRERSTGMHSRRVREYSLMLGGRLGLSRQELAALARGALLHDVGKIGIPDSVLLKPGRLDEEEWRLMRQHPGLGVALLGRVSSLRGAADVVGSHHEKFDGSGYPAGLSGEAIPLGARIFALADVLDALTSDRPYRSPLSFAEAARHLEEGCGSHFDPAVVEAFRSLPFTAWEEAASRFGLTLREFPPEEAAASRATDAKEPLSR